MQLRKESLKKSGLPGLEPWPLRYRCSALTNWANKPTGSWSLNWFVIYPGILRIFPGYITNQFNDQLPVGLLAQLVRALHRYRRGQGSSPGKPDFFRLSFRSCISCVNNCEDLLYIYFNFMTVTRSSVRRTSKVTPQTVVPLPWVFAVFQYCGQILPLIQSLWCPIQDEVYIMGCSAAGGGGGIQDGDHYDFTQN